jgi:hypothetical protein
MLNNITEAIEFLKSGYNPITGEKYEGLNGPYGLGPSVEFDYAGLFPYRRPHGLRAAEMADELVEHIGQINKIEDIRLRGSELLRVARYLSAETMFGMEDSIELLNFLAKGNSTAAFVDLVVDKAIKAKEEIPKYFDKMLQPPERSVERMM